jgi:transposase
MPCSIPEDKRTRIQIKLNLDLPTKTIAKDSHVSLRSVQRFSKNLRDYGAIKRPKAVNQGRPRKIMPEMEEVYSQLTSSMPSKSVTLGPT